MYFRLLMCTFFSGMQTYPWNEHSAVRLNQNIIVYVNIHIIYTAENVS